MTEYIISRADLLAIQRTKIDLYGGVELVRCKDCKYAYKTFNSYTCQRVFHPFTIEDDGFCSWAERRTNETD